jgi:hypothetical protein
MQGMHGRVSLLTSQWPGSREKKKKGLRSQYALQGHVLDDLIFFY